MPSKPVHKNRQYYVLMHKHAGRIKLTAFSHCFRSWPERYQTVLLGYNSYKILRVSYYKHYLRNVHSLEGAEVTFHTFLISTLHEGEKSALRIKHIYPRERIPECSLRRCVGPRAGQNAVVMENTAALNENRTLIVQPQSLF